MQYQETYAREHIMYVRRAPASAQLFCGCQTDEVTGQCHITDCIIARVRAQNYGFSQGLGICQRRVAKGRCTVSLQSGAYEA